MKITDEDRERYDIPHVDEIQCEELEREYEMRDEVFPDECEPDGS